MDKSNKIEKEREVQSHKPPLKISSEEEFF